MVTIIIPNFNRSKYLTQAIQSVKNQSLQEWELLVVDDGSTDDSESRVLLLAEKDNRIKWIPRKGNKKGAPVCRNIGVSLAKNNFIIFLDSDDLLAPHCLERRIQAMENSFLDFAVFPMLLFEKEPEDAQYLWNVENSENDVDRFLKLDAVWQTTGSIWKKSSFLELSGFDEKLKCWQDVDIHLRALLKNMRYQKFYNLPPDCYYRSDNKTSLSRNINSPEKLISRFFLLQKISSLVDNKNQLKALSSNILISTLNVRNWFFFMRTLYWSIRNSIFNFNELADFAKMGIIKFTRIYEMIWFSHIYENLKEKYIPQTTQGKILADYNK